MKNKLFIILLLLLSICTISAYAQQPSIISNGVTWDFQGGYSILTGDYSSGLNNGIHAGINGFYPLARFSDYLFLDFGIGMSRWTFADSSESTFSLYSVMAGGIFCYSFFNYFHPYFGIAFEEAVIHLKAARLNEEEIYYKPGVIVKAGFFGPDISGIGIRIGAQYEFIQISGDQLKPLTITASVFINFNVRYNHDNVKSNETVPDVEKIFTAGRTEFEKGNFPEAKKLFLILLDADSRHKESSEYLKRIDKIEKTYERAMRLIAGKQYFNAIPLLESTLSHLKKAKAGLIKLRKILKVKVPGFEKAGISSYDSKDYDNCIFFMRRILLIDPGNSVAKIYLPRSVIRKKALERLK